MLAKSDKTLIRSLREKAERHLQQMFIAEGSRLVLDLLRHSGDRLILLACTPEWISTHHAKLANFDDKIKSCSDTELRQMAALKTTNEVLAVFGFPAWYNSKPIPTEKTVFLERTNDPGNLGTIIRTCDWFGIDQIFASPDTVDIFNNKTVQATMSSIARVKLFYLDFDQLANLYSAYPIISACLDQQAIQPSQLPRSGILCMGNEANGLSDKLLNRSDYKVMIPGHKSLGAESLNVSVATGIILSQWL